eukprot:12427198-Karenia_brevis.AAC.1
MYTAVEENGKLPDQLDYVMVPFIPKREGGRRPIGLMTALIRLWGRARCPLVQKWETEHAREYFWASAGKPCERCVWQHALWDEYAVGSGACAATVLLDIIKCFEQVPHTVLLEEAISNEYPLAILRVVLAVYCSWRVIVVESCAAPPCRASRTVIAGCFAAVSLL